MVLVYLRYGNAISYIHIGQQLAVLQALIDENSFTY